MGAAVTISAPHSLWKIEGDPNRLHSDDDKRRVLQQYDTLVFDECDWGNEQLRHISLIATHALQFSMTASPLTGDIADEELAEKFLKRFVIISKEAIADYKRCRFRSCLKLFAPAIAAEHSGYEYLSSGSPNESANQSPPDHALFQSAIIQAVIEADQRETHMKEVAPEDYYSPHIMTRMGSIAEIKAMMSQLEPVLKKLYSAGVITNIGWLPTPIYQGHERNVEPNERDLSAK